MYFTTWHKKFLLNILFIISSSIKCVQNQQQQQQPPLQQQQQQQQHQQPPQQLQQQQYQQQTVQTTQLNQEIPKPWYENLPAVAMDYKVHIEAGKEDCYHQYVQPGATFYVSFSVVRGGDGMAGFAVRNPNGQIVKPYEWQATADYTDQLSTGGYYSVCIDNQFSRFAGKLINVYMTVVKYDAWDKYTKEIEALQLNMDNFTSAINAVERNINDIIVHQYHSRNREARDYALLLDNNSYIQTFSLCQIAVILITCSVQVVFVRKLFNIRDNSRSRI